MNDYGKIDSKGKLPSTAKCHCLKVYVRKLFQLKNDGEKEYLCLFSICTANLNEINNMNHIQTLFMYVKLPEVCDAHTS